MCIKYCDIYYFFGWLMYDLSWLQHHANNAAQSDV